MPRGSRGGGEAVVVLSEVAVNIVAAEDEARFRDSMQTHHYLGAAPGMGETVRYVAHHRGRWLALAVFSAPALKCGARDRWIGWDRSLQFGRLHLVTNNARFLILPGGGRNLGSRVLSLCTRRLVSDWPARFGHDVLLAETFVDPARFHGTVYRAANWIEVGRTRGFARGGHGYSEHARPKLVFLHPLSRTARARLRAAHLDPRLRHGEPRTMLSAAQMRSLPEFFQDIDDPRRRQGRRHALPTVLAPREPTAAPSPERPASTARSGSCNAADSPPPAHRSGRSPSGIRRRTPDDPAASPPPPDPIRHEPCRRRCRPSRPLGRPPAQRWDDHPQGDPQGPLAIRSSLQSTRDSRNPAHSQLPDLGL